MGVVRVRRGKEFDTSVKADALVTDDRSRVLSVRVADCVPVLIASATGDRVAAVQCRLAAVVIAGVVPVALRELAGETPAGEFVAAIGPCIGYDAFEVGREVLDEFVRVFGPAAPCRPRAPPRKRAASISRQAVRQQLHRRGRS